MGAAINPEVAGTVLFDMAGTLCSSPVNWERENTEGARRISPIVGEDAAAEILKTARQARTRAKQERIEYRLRDIIVRIMSQYGQNNNSQQIDEILKAYIGPELEITNIRPGMPELLKQLYNRKYTLIVVSNSPTEEFVLFPLEKAGVKQYFSHVLISSQIGYRKPHERFTLAVKHLLGSGKAVMVGDRLYDDVGLANALHISSILFAVDDHPDNTSNREYLTPTAIATDIPQLSESIRQLCALEAPV